ncbi:hypothetical protein MPLB_1490094 [Mesorhizobium sp. ORS 3324]|nr:hypothetical protein MPLB_1490094 [Mesorhizobium sp. ORS 3324]
MAVVERCNEPLALARSTTYINCQPYNLENGKLFVKRLDRFHQLITDKVIAKDLGASAGCYLGEPLDNIK